MLSKKGLDFFQILTVLLPRKVTVGWELPYILNVFNNSKDIHDFRMYIPKKTVEYTYMCK